MMEDSLKLHFDINLNFGLLTHMALLFILPEKDSIETTHSFPDTLHDPLTSPSLLY